jgi:hypothetical protein
VCYAMLCWTARATRAVALDASATQGASYATIISASSPEIKALARRDLAISRPYIAPEIA